MSKLIKYSILVAGLFLFTFAATKVRAEQIVEELTYDDLLSQLNAKRTKISDSISDPYKNLKLHFGFGLLSTAHNYEVKNDPITSYFSGFQVSGGVDLFSQYWRSDILLRNFGQHSSANDSKNIRDIDLKGSHVIFNEDISHSIASGVGYRIFEYHKNEVGFTETSSHLLFSYSLAFVTKSQLSIGPEIAYRTAIVNQTSDRSSLDLTLKMDSSF